MKQIDALNLLKMGHNIFLTGAAGAGKTYVLNQYIRYLKAHQVRVAITASTGIAATHLQGMTLHAWSGIGIKDQLTSKDLENLFKDKRFLHRYKKTKVLIIDEVSMLHKHQLDMVDEIARYMTDSDKIFGGMQVILCGDFFQLPPVGGTEKNFVFDADVWKTGVFTICYLEEQHRQKNDPLLTILNQIRSGTAGEQTKVPLRTRYKKEPEGTTKPTRLYSRNVNVDNINEHELSKLTSEEKIFSMETVGPETLINHLKKGCLAPEILRLKIGAEVMFIKNDPLGRYVNGTRGVIVGFEKDEDAYPIVKTFDRRTITAEIDEWILEDGQRVLAKLLQIPLRLAWAMTIHKSQGMTLDAAEMDLGDAFEPGMGYVALSRVRRLSGLKLMNLNEMALKVYPLVLEKDDSFQSASREAVESLRALTEQDIQHRHQQTLHKRFDGSRKKTLTK